MSQTQATALGASRALLRVFLILNLGLAAILIIGLTASFPFESVLREYYSRRPPLDAHALIPTLRLAIIPGLALVAAIRVLLSRLLAIVETVRSGDPFVPENAARMKTIAWSLLAIQLLGIGFGVIARMLQAGGAQVDGWNLSLSGWLAVVLLFVLARVFEEGSRIRADLKAMI